MNQQPANLVTVYPATMLTVVLQYPTQQLQVNAISCRYLPATVQTMQQGVPAPQRVVAVEVISDPGTPNPVQPYQCYSNQLQAIVLPANALLQVRPYIV